MAKYSNTKAKINEKITTNGAQAITGGILNDVLQTMVDSLGADYQSGGLIQPGSSFSAGEQPVVFLATTPGTYTDFGGLVVADGEVALLVWSGSAWSKQTPDIATRTEVSQLGQEIDKKYTKPSTGIPASDMATGVIPDVSQFITRSVSDLANYYLKTETYTKDEVADLIGAIQQFHYEVYASLPATGESNVLYLIGPTGTGSDRYEEYVYSNGTFIKIGDTSIDLSGYVTTQALNAALADYTTTANLSQLLSQKENIANKVTSISEQSTDEQYPSAKVLFDMLFEKINVSLAKGDGGDASELLGADVTVTDTDHSQVVGTQQWAGTPLVFRLKAGTNYTVSSEDVGDLVTPEAQNAKSELDSIRNFIMNYFGSPLIVFADANVKSICATNWGEDGEISEKQASRVTSLSNKFQGNTDITSFDELEYFTGLTTINNGEFSGCTNLESAIFLNSLTITSVGANAFSNCSSLENINIPQGVTSIGEYAFRGCTSLKSINLPQSITYIGYGAFQNSYIEDELYLPNLTTISSGAFYGTHITKILNLGNITSIPADAFSGCTYLTDVVIPSTLTIIPGYIFKGCAALEKLTLHQDITNIGAAAFYYTKIDNDINLPNLTDLDGEAFAGTLIKTVQNLGSITVLHNSFNSCPNLTSIVLPSTLTSIDGYALSAITTLNTLTCNAAIPPTLGAGVFNRTPIAHIYVPAASVEAYKTATNWTAYASIIEAIPTA